MDKFGNILNQAAIRIDSALNNTRVTVANQDINLRYTSMLNPLVGYGEEVIGKSMAEVHGADQALTLEPMRREVLKDGISRHELIVITLDDDDNRKHHFDTTVHAILDDQKKIIGITTVAIDLTDIVEARETLTEANDRLIHVLDKVLD